MERRKFLLGAGSLAAAGAAAMGTGAFSTVEANRGLDVSVANDADGLLGLAQLQNPNSQQYVELSGSGATGDPQTISIVIESNNNGAGLNDDALTRISELFRVTNQGTQEVFAWATGLPTNPRVALGSGPTSQIQNAGTANGQNQVNVNPAGSGGAFSSNSSLQAQFGGSGTEGAPRLAPGDYVDVELFAFGSLDGLDFDDTITINAVDVDEF